METFKEFVERDRFVGFIQEAFNGTQVQATTPSQKPWSASKTEILDMWKKLRPDSPIYLQPMDETEPTSVQASHSNYGEDGLRITGSWPFIASLLGRLKELLQYENPQTKLRLVFRGIDSSRQANPEKQSYVFYLNLQQRGQGHKGPSAGSAPG